MMIISYLHYVIIVATMLDRIRCIIIEYGTLVRKDRASAKRCNTSYLIMHPYFNGYGIILGWLLYFLCFIISFCFAKYNLVFCIIYIGFGVDILQLHQSMHLYLLYFENNH